MTNLRWIILVVSAGLAAFGAHPARAADEPSSARPRVAVSRVPRRPALVDFLDMSAPRDLAEGMAHVTGFVQREPTDGAPASQETHVYLGYDDENFYAAFIAFDDEPEKIRARLARRENFSGDDLVEIQLDTFHDERRAFSFLCNPLGIQMDALWTEGQRNNFDRAWDTVWQSEGQVTNRGFVVLMTIPFKSLRFSGDTEQEWGLVLGRDVKRSNEETFWPPISNRIEGRLNQAATLTGVSDISPGRNIWLIPYATGRRFETLDRETGDTNRESFDGDIGLDAKVVIKDSFTLDMTLNPDFSQVESDLPQVTVNQRFEVRFPERRPFFLENADFFQTPINMLFTRRIADPQVGARLTGKTDGWSIGAIVIDDEAPGKVDENGDLRPPDDPLLDDRAWFGILRVIRDVGEQSRIGLMSTRRDFDVESNQVFGIDGRIKLDDNWDTQFHAAFSETDTLDGESLSDPNYSLSVNRSGRTFSTHLHYRDIFPEFRADVGFVPRTDVKDYHANFTYTLWPENNKLINWGGQVFFQRILDHTQLRQDRVVTPTLFWEFPGQTELRASYSFRDELLRVQDFPELPMNTDFSTDSLQLRFETEFIKTLSLNAGLSVGNGINFVPPDGEAPSSADRLDANAGVTLRLGRHTRIDGTYLLAQLTDPVSDQMIFTNQIVRTRLNWQLDPKFSVRLILQYEETDTNSALTSLENVDRFNGDLLLTYLVNPWTAIYLGYNSNYENLEIVEDGNGNSEVVRTRNDFYNDARQLFFKVNYLFQF